MQMLIGYFQLCPFFYEKTYRSDNAFQRYRISF